MREAIDNFTDVDTSERKPMHTATYSPEDNKIRIYPAQRLDDELGDEYASFKAAGYKWASKQECFVCPRWTPHAEDWALRLCGEIDDEDYSPEERSADRAERFGDYRDKRSAEAHGHADTFEAGPAAFGHQNRARAERQAARHDRHRGRAVSQWSKAEYWQQRTAGVIAHALHRSSAPVRRGRILRLEAEQRQHEKSRAEYARKYAAWSKVATLEGADKPIMQENGELYATPAGKLAYALANDSHSYDYQHPRKDRKTSLYSLLTDTDPITPTEAAAMWLDGCCEPSNENSRQARWSRHYELRLTYEKAMLAEEGGTAAEADMEPGGWINASTRTGSVFTHVDGGWMQVHAVNKSPATGRVTSVKVMGKVGVSNPTPGLVSINVERLGEGNYRAPTDEEREAFTVATKQRKAAAKAKRPAAPPLINPTDADAERLQAIWNDHAKARHDANDRHSTFTPSEVRRMTQAEYSAASKGTYSHVETVDVSEQLKSRRSSPMGRDTSGRVTVFKVRKSSAGGFYGANRVIVLTDKPQKPVPWELVEEIADEQPSEAKLLPRMPELAKICALNWLPESSTPERTLLEDAAYVGWTYISSMSQFGWTPAGYEVLKRYEKEHKAAPLPPVHAEPVAAGLLF